MSDIVALVLFAVGSYLLGDVNWAILISKFLKKDIRSMGSGNPGTLNMSRNLGLKIGLLTFLLDVLKGVIPCLVVYFVFNGKYFENTNFLITDFAIYLCGLCVVLGHIYPVFLKFKGGKGIASTIGVMLVCESIHGFGWSSVAIMSIIAALLFIYFTEFGAMGSFIAITPPAISASIRLFLTYGVNAQITNVVFYVITNMFIFALCFFTWFAHRKNIKKMLSGDEHPTSIKTMVVKMKAKKIAKNNDESANVSQEDNKN